MIMILHGKHVHLSPAVHRYTTGAAEAMLSKYALNPTNLKGTLDKTREDDFHLTLTAHLEKGWVERVEGTHKNAYKAIDNSFSALESRIKAHKKRTTDHTKHHDNHHYLTKVKLAEMLSAY